MKSDLLGGIRLTVHETARAALLCFECDKLTSFDDGAVEVIPDALRGRPPLCATCGAAIDVWKNSVLALTAGEGGLAMAAQVGARHTAILYRLAVGEVVSFDIRDKDVPADAQLLRITHRAALEVFQRRCSMISSSPEVLNLFRKSCKFRRICSL